MAELRLLAVSEDGTQLLLAGDGETYRLPIDDRLRAAVRSDRTRPGRTENAMESQLRPADIQARIRAGHSTEAVAEAAGISVERVRRFEGAVLAERAHIAHLAQTTSVRRPGDGPSPALGEIVGQRLKSSGQDPDSAVWDAWRRDDNRWTVVVSWGSESAASSARWVYDPARRAVTADDDAASDLSGAERPPAAPAAPSGDAGTRDAGQRFVPRLAAVPDDRSAGQPEHAAGSARPAAGRATGTDGAEEAGGAGAEEPPAAAQAGAARRAAGERRGARRPTVPSWDEIVFGRRPRD